MDNGHPGTESSVQPALRVLQGPSSRPGRVLILSADMGEGHNVAAAAITEALNEIWPGCEVERYDTWQLWSPSFSRAACWGYKVQMSLLPATYEVIYQQLCRSSRFTAVFKAVLRRFFGGRLEEFLADRSYDLIISTYPFASAALDWLQSRGTSIAPTVTCVPAFHVHPMWTYPGINRHYVIYDTASEHARTEGFLKTMRVGAPPVRRCFGTVPKHEARRRLGLHGDTFTVLVTGGAWGLGGISDAVRALTEEPHVRVLAVCGKNKKLAQGLTALGVGGEHLRVLGYVENMHELMAAADVVVTNGAGVTVLEALRTPRPVIAFRPLAGHGRAATEEMIRRDLALVAHDLPSLVWEVRRLASDGMLLSRMEQAGRAWGEGRDLRDNVREMTHLVVDRHAAVLARDPRGLTAS